MLNHPYPYLSPISTLVLTRLYCILDSAFDSFFPTATALAPPPPPPPPAQQTKENNEKKKKIKKAEKKKTVCRRGL